MSRLISPKSIASGIAVVLVFAAIGLVTLGGVFAGSPSAASPGAALPTAKREHVRFEPAALRAGRRPGESVIVRATHQRLAVYRHRGDRRRGQTLRPLVVEGHRVPLTLLTIRAHGPWLHVRLPIRPNGATGWVRRRDVRTFTTRLRIVVRLTRHRLELVSGRRTVLRRRIGVGRSLSPTPTGRYFVVDLLKPPDAAGFYGPYALGLSAYSPVYTSFAGGNGQVGIHGTNQASMLGRDVSHGCIRLDNRTITLLAHRVPLGTPVDIRRS